MLYKPAEARVTKWQEQLEASDSNLKKYDLHQKERLPGDHTMPWRTRLTECARDSPSLRQRNICGATWRARTVCVARPHAISTTFCEHFGERPSKDDIGKM